jgi:hypothetical protein
VPRQCARACSAGFYYLLKNPAYAAKIRQEVDTVCGADPITFAQLNKLEHIDAALKDRVLQEVVEEEGEESRGGLRSAERSLPLPTSCPAMRNVTSWYRMLSSSTTS